MPKNLQTRFVGIRYSQPLYIPMLALLDYHRPIDVDLFKACYPQSALDLHVGEIHIVSCHISFIQSSYYFITVRCPTFPKLYQLMLTTKINIIFISCHNILIISIIIIITYVYYSYNKINSGLNGLINTLSYSLIKIE